MIKTIRDEYGLVSRHEFVPKGFQKVAYEDKPIEIGFGQTMSQPYTVAMMTHLATEIPNTKYQFSNRLQNTNRTSGKIKRRKVLEIGTGSGYQAALLSYFFDEVYTIEIIPQLSEFGRNNLFRLGYKNVFVREGSGEYGWKEKSPFDAIIITAALEKDLPPVLKTQLVKGGILVAPIGPRYSQVMTRFARLKNGKFKKEEFQKFVFVPFVRNE